MGYIGKVPTAVPITTSDLADGIVTNSKLANSSLTVNGTTISLGASDTITAGKVLQTVQSQDTSQTAMNTTSYVDTGLSATITPSSTSSKILIMWNNQCKINTGTSNNVLGFARTLRDSTEIGGASKFRQDGFVGESGFTLSYHYIDSPSTTSAITYKTQIKLQTSGDGRTLHDSILDGGMSPATWMVLMEIAW